MRYSELRPKIQTGDLLSCAGPGLFSRLIRFQTGQTVSHVGLAVWVHFSNGKQRLCIFEAVEGYGVRLQPLRKYLETEYWNKNAHMWWQPLIDSTINGDKLLDFCLEHWSEKYANKYQFVIAMSPTIQKIRKVLGKSLDSNVRRWHCAELMSNALIHQKYPHDKEPVLTSPGDVTNFKCFGSSILIEEDLNAVD